MTRTLTALRLSSQDYESTGAIDDAEVTHNLQQEGGAHNADHGAMRISCIHTQGAISCPGGISHSRRVVRTQGEVLPVCERLKPFLNSHLLGENLSAILPKIALGSPVIESTLLSSQRHCCLQFSPLPVASLSPEWRIWGSLDFVLCCVPQSYNVLCLVSTC